MSTRNFELSDFKFQKKRKIELLLHDKKELSINL